MTSPDFNITPGQFPSRNQLLQQRRERSRVTEDKASYYLRLRGRIALMKAQVSKNREYVSIRRDLNSRAQQHQDRATELSTLAGLLGDRILDDKNLHLGADVKASINATMEDLHFLAEDQERTSQEIYSQIKDLNQTDSEIVQQLLQLNICSKKHNQELHSPSGISEEHRHAIVNRLETAAIRQEVRTMVQESLTWTEV